MARILAIDPGYEQSAFITVDTNTGMTLHGRGIVPNTEMLGIITRMPEVDSSFVCAIEMVASYGMAVGREVFETVKWSGRFVERWRMYSGREPAEVYRKEVKMHLCNSMRANDANIRAALIDRFGPGKEKAVGTKKNPGPLYGIKKDLWAALAVAVTFADTNHD